MGKVSISKLNFKTRYLGKKFFCYRMHYLNFYVFPLTRIYNFFLIMPKNNLPISIISYFLNLGVFGISFLVATDHKLTMSSYCYWQNFSFATQGPRWLNE